MDIKTERIDTIDPTGMKKCRICCKEFYNKYFLKRHLTIRHDVRLFRRDGSAIVFKKSTESFPLKDDPLKSGNEFKCPNCPSTFLKKKLFQNHMARHREQNYIICPVEGCSLRLFKGDRFGHIKRCHAPKFDEKGEVIKPEAICELCGKTGFKSMETYRKHKYKVHAPRCEVCNKKLKKKVPHVCEMKKEYGRLFKCSDCPKAFTTGKILKKHMKDNHNYTGISELTCIDCHRVFPTVHKLQSHKKICNCLQCTICGIGFRSEEKLVEHIAKHDKEERNFECEFCKCRFSKEIILKRHISKRHDEGPEEVRMNYECSKCDVMYRKSDLLRLHLESKHSVFIDNIDVTCVYCFELFEDLPAHVNSCHKRVHPCQLDGCKKKFRTEESLADHELKHDPNYKIDLFCTICSKECKTVKALSEHFKNHSKVAKSITKRKAAGRKSIKTEQMNEDVNSTFN